MEPILEKTVMEEEESVTKKKKMMRLTDYFLLGLIVILSIVFIIRECFGFRNPFSLTVLMFSVIFDRKKGSVTLWKLPLV